MDNQAAARGLQRVARILVEPPGEPATLEIDVREVGDAARASVVLPAWRVLSSDTALTPAAELRGPIAAPRRLTP